MTVVLESVLTCPHCGFTTQETMPTDACVYFYECRNRRRPWLTIDELRSIAVI